MTTVLEIVQEILSDIDGDSVDTYNETVESEQVYTIVKSSYFNLMASRMWPHLRQGVQLTALGGTTPTHLSIDTKVKELCFLNYDISTATDTRKRYQAMKYLSVDEFLHKTNQEDDSSSDVDVVTDTSGIDIMIRNDQAPQYFTSFNDEELVLDSYDSSIAAALVSTRVQAQAYIIPVWDALSAGDAYVPDIPEEAMRVLIEGAKSAAALRLTQVPDQKAEQEAVRQQRWLSRKARRIEGGLAYPDYGRKR